MAYPFPPAVEKLVQQHMTSGGYASEDELLLDALQALDQQRQMSVYDEAEVATGIARGLSEMQRGLGRPFEEFDAEFRAQTDSPNHG